MILFLDFDGVLHPEVCAYSLLFCHLPLLENLLRDFPDVEIVVTSTWRRAKSLDELQALFSEDIGRRVIGVTPLWFEVRELYESIGYQRQAEVEGWLQETGRLLEKWVAIDDHAGLFKPSLPNLVLCAPDVGIDEAVLKQLAGKLAD
jgi:hypothetical protein